MAKFLPGHKIGRPPGVENKSTAEARYAIARFVEKNAPRFESLLDQIEENDGPKAAWQCIESLLEYHIPKLARTEHTGADEGPMELVIRWGNEKS